MAAVKIQLIGKQKEVSTLATRLRVHVLDDGGLGSQEPHVTAGLNDEYDVIAVGNYTYPDRSFTPAAWLAVPGQPIRVVAIQFLVAVAYDFAT